MGRSCRGSECDSDAAHGEEPNCALDWCSFRAVTRKGLQAWLSRYELAWRTEGTSGLADVFAQRASYRMGPYKEVHRGLEAIAELWERERDGHDELFEMDADVVAVEGDTGVARVDLRYGKPVTQEYRELWVVRFDDQGLCAEFEEWPHWPPGTNGDASPSSRQAG